MKKDTKRAAGNNLFGIMFRPLALENNHAKIAHSTDMSVSGDFRKAYEKHMAGMQIVGMCAKVYITENWQKITDWSGLNVVITSPKDEITEYFYHKPRENKGKTDTLKRMFNKMDERDKARHNPVTIVTDVIMDEEFDFSMTINGEVHWWLTDDAVVVIASYIEQKLKERDKTGDQDRHESASGGEG